MAAIITSAGLQAMINAQATGTEKVKLSVMKFSSDVIEVTSATKDIGTVVCTCPATAGLNVGDGIIHVSGADGSQNVYDVHTVGVYTEDGILFAVNSSTEPLAQKVRLSSISIALDILITSVDPGVIDFGDASFANPPASTVTAGVVKIATESEILDGSDNSKCVSPYALKNALKKDNSILHADGNETIDGKKKFTQTVDASIFGNAETATKLQTAHNINNTAFDGTGDITTKKWGTARNIKIQDATGQNVSVAVSVDGSKDAVLQLPSKIVLADGIEGNASTSSKLQNARVLTINDTRDNLGAGVSFDGSKNVTISLPPYIATQLLKDKTKCFGNDYYDDSDITSLIYAGNGSGTVRAELAAGNFERLHPGQYIKGRVTGTTYVVVGCNVYLNRGDTSLTRNHLGLIPIQLVGNSGSLLWSGQRWTGDATKNTTQGYAPWNADNENVGKNVTCAYKDSYMAKTVIPKVINNWLKKDFEEQGISVLTFRNLFSTGFDANLPCMSYPAWKGACLYAEWADCKAVLMSEPEVYGGYRWASSPYDSHMQHLQLPLFRHRSIHEIIYADIWLKDVASVSGACRVHWGGCASGHYASHALRVCPLFLIA